MVNLIIDDHNFMLRSLFTYADKGSKLVDDMMDSTLYVEKVIKDFYSLHEKLEGFNLNKIIITQDSTSWRKSFNEEYKAKRVANNLVNWDNFWGVVNPEVKSRLSRYVNYHKEPRLESDDLMLYWVEKFKSMGQSSIIISSDGDLDQLLYKTDESWCIKLNLAGKKIHTTLDFNDWVNDILENKNQTTSKNEGFNMLFDNKPLMINRPERDTLINLKEFYNYYPVDVDKFMLEKIIKGDNSDNIKSVYVVNGRGIGDKGAQKYTPLFPDFKVNDLYSKEFKEKLADVIFLDKKMKLPKNTILENIEKNINLMLLSPEILDNNVENSSKIVREGIESILESDNNLLEIKSNFIDEVLSEVNFSSSDFKSLEERENELKIID